MFGRLANQFQSEIFPLHPCILYFCSLNALSMHACSLYDCSFKKLSLSTAAYTSVPFGLYFSFFLLFDTGSSKIRVPRNKLQTGISFEKKETNLYLAPLPRNFPSVDEFRFLVRHDFRRHLEDQVLHHTPSFILLFVPSCFGLSYNKIGLLKRSLS